MAIVVVQRLYPTSRRDLQGKEDAAASSPIQGARIRQIGQGLSRSDLEPAKEADGGDCTRQLSS